MEEMTSRQLNRLNMSLPLRVCSSEHPGNPGSSDWRMNPRAEYTVTENFCSSGCYFYLSQEPPLGARLEMEITIPGNSPKAPFAKIYCQGKVVRVDRHSLSQGWEEVRFGVASTIEISEDVYAESISNPLRPSGASVRAAVPA